MKEPRVKNKNGGKHTNHVKCLPNIKKLEPKTANQARIIEAYRNGKNLVVNGLAGTGKTFVALSLALQYVERGLADGVSIYRSAVPTRDMGFMPGTRQEKEALYEIPYRTLAAELYDRADAYDLLKKSGIIEFSTTSYLRGLTIRNSVIIVDEMQNLSGHEADSIMTRIGEGSRIFFCGDYTQTDLKKDDEKKGIRKFTDIVSRMEEFDFVEMGVDDIVRSSLVKSYILAKKAVEEEVH